MLNQNFKEFIRSLNANNVRYLIVGGYAVAFHGHPRYTKDLDIWIEADETNVTRLISALDDFGLGSLGLRKEDFSDPDMVVQLGYAPNRIDLIMSLKGIQFESSFESKVVSEMEDIPVNFIGLDPLRTNKKATGRRQDLADLENLGK